MGWGVESCFCESAGVTTPVTPAGGMHRIPLHVQRPHTQLVSLTQKQLHHKQNSSLQSYRVINIVIVQLLVH